MKLIIGTANFSKTNPRFQSKKGLFKINPFIPEQFRLPELR